MKFYPHFPCPYPLLSSPLLFWPSSVLSLTSFFLPLPSSLTSNCTDSPFFSLSFHISSFLSLSLYTTTPFAFPLYFSTSMIYLHSHIVLFRPFIPLTPTIRCRSFTPLFSPLYSLPCLSSLQVPLLLISPHLSLFSLSSPEHHSASCVLSIKASQITLLLITSFPLFHITYFLGCCCFGCTLDEETTVATVGFDDIQNEHCNSCFSGTFPL